MDVPAFEPVGDLVGIPSFPLPGRGEYRVRMGLPRAVRQDIAAFRPNIVHIASPDIIGHRAVSWAQRNDVPAVASVHTRFDTYFRYYRMADRTSVLQGTRLSVRVDPGGRRIIQKKKH